MGFQTLVQSRAEAEVNGKEDDEILLPRGIGDSHPQRNPAHAGIRAGVDGDDDVATLARKGERLLFLLPFGGVRVHEGERWEGGHPQAHGPPPVGDVKGVEAQGVSPHGGQELPHAQELPVVVRHKEAGGVLLPRFPLFSCGVWGAGRESE